MRQGCASCSAMSEAAMARVIGSTAAYPLLGRASRLVEEGRFEQAAQVLITHLREHPDEPRGLVMLGQTATRLGALGQAEQFLRRAIARGASDHSVRRELAS